MFRFGVDFLFLASIPCLFPAPQPGPLLRTASPQSTDITCRSAPALRTSSKKTQGKKNNQPTNRKN